MRRRNRGRPFRDLPMDLSPWFLNDPAYDHADDEGDELMDLEASDLGPTDPGDDYWREEVKHDDTR